MIELALALTADYLNEKDISGLACVNRGLAKTLDESYFWYLRCKSDSKCTGDFTNMVNWKCLSRDDCEDFVIAKVGNAKLKIPLSRSISNEVWLEVLSKKLRSILATKFACVRRLHGNDRPGTVLNPGEKSYEVEVDFFSQEKQPSDGIQGTVMIHFNKNTFLVDFRKDTISSLAKFLALLKSKLNLSENLKFEKSHETAANTFYSDEELFSTRLNEDFRLVGGESFSIDSNFSLRRNHWNTPNPPQNPIPPVSPISENLVSIESLKVLSTSKDARQFEFHPMYKELLLIGKRSGHCCLVNAESDTIIASEPIDNSPILGLSWLNRHPNLAVYGSALAGSIGLLHLNDQESSISKSIIGNFRNLSSITVNCTDDYLMSSGFSRDIALYDLPTGKQIAFMEEIHSNFINILRFSHSNPHIYATSSFDYTCKLWDLRVKSKNPLFIGRTDSLNVMCSFSKDDSRLLVSGLDSHVTQFSVNHSLSKIPIKYQIDPKNSNTNYRRSVYLNGENGDHGYFATAGTDESTVQFIDANTGRHSGEFDFKGTLASSNSNTQMTMDSPNAVQEEQAPRDAGSLFGNLVSRLLLMGRRTDNYVELFDDQSRPGMYNSNPIRVGEYVQSLRSSKDRLGVLLSPFDRNADSYIALTQFKMSAHTPQHAAAHGF
jgi:WD40 repeat protein